jgi:DNA-directed RNA polymerase specialized sigma24 family protein
MATARVFKSKEDFADEVSRLQRSRQQSARLRQAAIFLAKVGGLEADDLLQEAITRGIEGRRRWPDHIDIVTFLAMVMKSIVNGERRKAGLRPERDPDDEGDPDIHADTSPEGLGRRADDILVSEEERRALIGMFEGDDEAKMILEGRLGGMEGDELRQFVGLDETQYKSKLRKIRRAINKAYTAGKDRK